MLNGGKERIYAYCIIDRNGIAGAGKMSGIEDAPVRTVPYRDIGMVVSSLRYPVSTRDSNIFRHEEVIDSFMEHCTVLPMRFNTVFKKRNDIRTTMERRYGIWKADLKRLEGKVEFGLKVLWDEEIIRNRVKKDLKMNAKPKESSGMTNGTEYIADRLYEYKLKHVMGLEAEIYIKGIHDIIDDCVVERETRRLQTPNLMLNGSYLIEKERKSLFMLKCQQLKGTYPEFRYLLSGPWPPYNFVKTDG